MKRAFGGHIMANDVVDKVFIREKDALLLEGR